MYDTPQEMTMEPEPELGGAYTDQTEWAARESEWQEERPDELMSPEAA